MKLRAQTEGPLADALAEDLRALGRHETVAGWEQVASSGFARVHHNQVHGVYCKEFLPRSHFDVVKSWIRGDRSIRARRCSLDLASAGFSTPRPLAWGLYSPHRGFLVTEAVSAAGVTEWLQTHESSDRPQRWRLLESLGEEIGRLHGAGFVHGDLRTSNVLVAQDRDEFRFYFIDNERNSRHREIPLKLVQKNLIQMDMLLPQDLSRSDRVRFFHRYCSAYGRFDPQAARSLALAVDQRARARLAAKGLLSPGL